MYSKEFVMIHIEVMDDISFLRLATLLIVKLARTVRIMSRDWSCSLRLRYNVRLVRGFHLNAWIIGPQVDEVWTLRE